MLNRSIRRVYSSLESRKYRSTRKRELRDSRSQWQIQNNKLANGHRLNVDSRLTNTSDTIHAMLAESTQGLLVIRLYPSHAAAAIGAAAESKPSAYWNSPEFSYYSIISQPYPIHSLEDRHTSYMSNAISQLSFTTLGASGRVAHSFRCGKTSGVAIPPRASAASCLTISDSEPSSRTFSRGVIERGWRSCPNTNAISCLLNVYVRTRRKTCEILRLT